MKHLQRWIGLSLLTLLLVMGANTQTSAQSVPTIVQTLPAFHRPESSSFSLDGRYLYVGNCASGLYGDAQNFGLARGEGAISQLSVGANGQLTMVNPRFVSGLTAPLGMSVLPKATRKFPQGTLFVNVGYYQQTDSAGNYETDPARLGTGVVIIDSQTGKILGRLVGSIGSTIAQAIGHPLMVPNGLAFDRDGNLYIAETGASGDFLKPSIASQPGIVRINRRALDALASGRPAAGITFLEVPGGPNGVMYDAATDAVYFVTAGEADPENGAIYKIPRQDFPSASLPPPIARNLTALDGLVMTANGTLIASRNKGDLVAVKPDGDISPLPLSPATTFVFPSDIKLQTLEDGSALLIVPEQAFKDPKPWKQRLRAIRIPAQ